MNALKSQEDQSYKIFYSIINSFVIILGITAILIGVIALRVLGGDNMTIFQALRSLTEIGAWTFIGLGATISIAGTLFFVIKNSSYFCSIMNKTYPSFDKSSKKMNLENTDTNNKVSTQIETSVLLNPNESFLKEKNALKNQIMQVYEEDFCSFTDFFEKINKEQRTAIILYYINWKHNIYCEQQLNDFQIIEDNFKENFSKSLRDRINKKPLKADETDAAYLARHIYDSVTGIVPLYVTVNEDEMLEAYIKYNRLILLRPLKSDVLMLGCGLGYCRQDKSESHKSTHKNIDTVDIIISRNPDVICFWGDEKQCAFFKDRYALIYDEGPIISFIANKEDFYKCCSLAFKKNLSENLVVLGGHIFSSPSLLEKRTSCLPPSNEYEQIYSSPLLVHKFSYDPAIYRRVIVD